VIALPVFTGYAHPDGRVSSLLLRHYEELAASGAAMVVVANAAVSQDGVTSANNLRADGDDFIDGLAVLAATIGKHGALSCLQLNHAGRFARTEKPLLPSPITGRNLAFQVASFKHFMEFFPLEKRFGLTRRFLGMASRWSSAMTEDECRRVVADFGAAAKRAFRAGFDMVEIHGASGYLINQFLSAFTHRVPAEAGDGFHQRTRFPLSVVREVKRNLPEGFPVGFRILLQEWVPEGIDLQQALAWAGILEEEGVAYLSATAGTHISVFDPAVMRLTARQAYLRKDTAELSARVRVPTIISGRITRPETAEKLLEEGAASLIGLARALRVDPEWLRKARLGKKPHPCIDCNGCFKQVIQDRAFVCRRWPGWKQVRAELEHRLLSRNHRSLWVTADPGDLEHLLTFLPLLLPLRQSDCPRVSAGVFFPESAENGHFPEDAAERFLAEGRQILSRLDWNPKDLERAVALPGTTPDETIAALIRQGSYGMVFMGRNRSQPWRERVLYRQRGKILALIGPHENANRVLAAVDFSFATLLILKFLHLSMEGKKKPRLDFVHILTGSPIQPLRRWEQLKKISGADPAWKLRLVPIQSDVPMDLSREIRNGGYGTVVMGKRGYSGIKRWLLGSVSSSVLRSLTDQTMVLVD
jgi:2,4-dienoyl-CoA reductase (NADPH2)